MPVTPACPLVICLTLTDFSIRPEAVKKSINRWSAEARARLHEVYDDLVRLAYIRELLARTEQLGHVLDDLVVLGAER